MSAKVQMLRERVTVLRPGQFGPRNRRHMAETCICGIQFTHYWKHRETAHHKRFMAAERRKRRAAR
jgi:hypothetical protein